VLFRSGGRGERMVMMLLSCVVRGYEYSVHLCVD
jgi:hypothetical protein